MRKLLSLIFMFCLVIPTALFAQEVDVIQPAFNAIIDALGAKWNVVFVVVGVLATLLAIFKIVMGAVEAYVISTADKKDDEKFAKFKNHIATKVILYILGLCGAYKDSKKK